MTQQTCMTSYYGLFNLYYTTAEYPDLLLVKMIKAVLPSHSYHIPVS